MIRVACALLLVLVATEARADSFTVRSPEARCTGRDQILVWLLPGQAPKIPKDVPGLVPNAATAPGAGVMPPAFTIRGVQVIHYMTRPDPQAYAIAGYSGPGGDIISPWVAGGAVFPPLMGLAVKAFAPWWIDVHASCRPPGTHRAILHVFYSVP
jgi:hypothetical protein